MVVCQETWQDVDPKTVEIVTKRSRHAWISSEPVTPRNLHQRYNLCARHRWGIETCIQVEKGHGYSYEHCFFFNVLAQLSDKLAAMVRSMTMRGFFSFIRLTVAGKWLTPELVAARLRGCLQLRLE